MSRYFEKDEALRQGSLADPERHINDARSFREPSLRLRRADKLPRPAAKGSLNV